MFVNWNEQESAKVLEFLAWGKEKGVTDEVFLKALNKLEYAIRQEKKKQERIEKSKDTSYLDDLSKETSEFICEEIFAGKKNRYNSIYAILKSRAESNKLKDYESELNEYLNSKRAINELPEHEKEITELFRYCYDKLKNYEPFRYLKQLTPDARNLVAKKIEQGYKNLYHSVMAQFGRREIEDLETEYKKYLVKAKKRFGIVPEEEKALKELFTSCYEKKGF